MSEPAAKPPEPAPPAPVAWPACDPGCTGKRIWLGDGKTEHTYCLHNYGRVPARKP